LRVVLIALVALVAVGSIISTLPATESKSQNPAPKPTFSDGACLDAGVTEVIDFGEQHSPVVYCATNFVGTGWDLLAQRVDVSGTDEYPTGFVCRIEGVPSASEQDCANTPTYKEGSWVYFVADLDSAGWVMSPAGAGMRKPGCGTSDAWVFSGSDRPERVIPSVEPTVFKCAD
jgi:hypothetical protein